MKTSTRFRNLVKKMVLPLAVGCVMSATGALAQSGDILGFYSASKNATFTTPGSTVEFTVRLAGLIGVSNLFNNAFVQPQFQMEVGSDGAIAYATLVRSSYSYGLSGPYDPLTRTELTFAYVIRPGDMAMPLRLFGDGTTGFVIADNESWIYKAYAGGVVSNVTWTVDRTKLILPRDAIVSDPSNAELSSQNITIRTLSFDINNTISVVAREPSSLWRIRSGATNASPVKVVVWTPHTNVLQIGSSPNQSLEVTIPPGLDYADFAIKGLDTNATPTIATVYVQRPSDFNNNNSIGVTNFISSPLFIDPPGEPKISIQFSNGQAQQTLAETNEVNTGWLQIFLSETHTNNVYVDLNIEHLPIGLTNVVMEQQGGYYVRAGQSLSERYYFNVVNGTRDSARSPYVKITPIGSTNATKYTASPGIGYLTVLNVAPTVQWFVPATGDENNPVTFDWYNLADVDADLARGVAFRWDFGDGSRVTYTNFTFDGQVSKTYASVGDVPRTYTVTLTITDADGGSYTLPSQLITISPAPKPANISVVVNRADYTYIEGDTSAEYKVILSVPALQETWVELEGRYLVDDTSSDDCLLLSVTNNIVIPAGLTSSVPYTMTLKDGTLKTATGIKIIPRITTPAALIQYPGSYYGIVRIQNAAPGIDTVPTCQPTTVALPPYNAIEQNKPFNFRYKATDIPADANGTPPITVEFQFEDGSAVTNTGVNGIVTKTFNQQGPQFVTMIATDKDGGQRTVTFPITIVPPLPPPSVTVFPYPFLIPENDANPKTFTIQLSQTPISAGLTNPVVVTLVTTPVNSAVNGAITVPPSVIFYSTDTTKLVNFSVQDGTPDSLINGFFVAPQILGQPDAAAVYTQLIPGYALIRNVAPVFLLPLDGSTNTVATVGQPRIFNWSVQDVAADRPTMQLVWDWGDGTTSTTTGASGSITHTYLTASSQRAVTVTATDKDGDFTIISFYVNVKDSKRVIALPIGENTAGFNGLTDLGKGTIAAPGASPTVWDPVNLLYTFYFSADEFSAQLIASPTNALDPLRNRKSYFFAWDGPIAAFQNPAHVTRPLAPASTIINLPSGTAGSSTAGGTATTINGSLVQVSAIFTLAYHRNDVEITPGINNGDLNQDGIPDRLVQRYFVDPTATTGTDTSINEVWFQNLGGYNEDEDYLPVYPTGDNQGVLDFRPVPNPRTAVDDVAVNAFTAFMEVRGYDGYLGTADDPLTDPTENDSDNDGYPDGWEYWFWYQSNINGRLGSRYNPFNVAQGDLIDFGDIVDAFDPMKPRSAFTGELWRDDFDNDGLLDIEEMVVGTDPTNWDTDGDLMVDGWELNNGFNPRDVRDGSLRTDQGRGTDYDNNPDGDYFAISTAPRVHIEIVTTNGGFFPGDPQTTTTNHYFAVADPVTGLPDETTLTTAYRYGNDAEGPWAVGRPVAAAVLTPVNLISRTDIPNSNPLIMHFQVRNEYDFDPRTAWIGTVPRFGGYGAGPRSASRLAV
jgi:hypothetical protein